MLAPVHLPAPGAAIAASARAALPVLETDRLVLRAPELGDFALFADLLSGDRARFMGGPQDELQSWYDFANYSAGWLLRGDGMFTVTEDSTPVGFIFAGCEPKDRGIELGFMMSAAAEGRGLAFEAATAARDHLFSIGAPSILSFVAPGNARARALAERLGGTLDASSTPRTCVYRYARDLAVLPPEGSA
ncbi:GNAT family N-acetyltransferase [Oceanomicrobium pacificus]|uniref:GNAT family N-acetyltransferase n=1 Tax=Oceanomicrobium pacificus TaxID=2692916 RepID=A0A6B0TYS4_9RHOB|nr:GNAT family N-acetyltransferase [Oceanomicrobium pacificus]MXU66835.1 GNAT family N-acetyltransferase [Oceanomicrobium pacificus]